MSRGTPDTASSVLFSCTRLSLSLAGFPKTLPLTNQDTCCCPLPRRTNPSVWALSLSLAATQEIDFSFSSSGYLDVSVHRVPSAYLCIQYAVTEVCSARFPHSEICGSMDICSSPQLIAAYHVFHRLSVPRHPPCALFCLTSDKVSLLYLISSYSVTN